MPLRVIHDTAPDASFTGTGSAAWAANHTLELENNVLVGRFSAGTGAPESVSLATGLAVAGGTLGLSTTGITSGAYGGVAGVPRFDIGGDGRVTLGLNVILQATSPLTLTTSGTGTLAWSLSTTGVSTGLPGTTAISFLGVDAWGRGTSRGTISDFSISGAATMGGLVSTRGVQAAVGSSATVGYSITGPYVNANPVSLNTVAGTLMTYNLPANAITGSGQGLCFSMWGTSQAGLANSRRFALTFGTATVAAFMSTTTNAQTWYWEGYIAGQSSTQQQFLSHIDVNNAGGFLVTELNAGTLGMTLSTETPLAIVGTGTTTGGIRTQNGMLITFLGQQ